MTIGNELNVNNYVNQTELKLNPDTKVQTKSNKNLADYFDYIYSYPPKIQIKWDSVDELNGDLFIGSNYGVLEHSIPFVDVVDDWFFNDSTKEAITENRQFSEYLNGYLDKINSSNFFLKKTKKIQTALSSIPIFAVFNGQGEIILSKPANNLGSNSLKNYINEKTYDLCGAFDHSIEKKGSLGLFFMTRHDAENYLKEVAKTDFKGTKTVGLSIHCINLSSAYKITREHHPGIDFRFVPNVKELRTLLGDTVGKSDMIVEDEQQQLRFRRRTTNLFPYLNKLGRFLSPSSSFLQRNEYFKGVPIYVVQLNEKPRNFFVEQCFNTLGYLDTFYNSFVQCIDSTIGFGHNLIMQGSIKDAGYSDNFENYVFFEKTQALQFVKKYGRYATRYTGSRTSNLEFAVRKPKIFIYNLEDLLEDWEDRILGEQIDNNENSLAFFRGKNIHFISPNFTLDKSDNLNNDIKTSKQNTLKNVTQILNVKCRVLKQAVGVFFSVN